MPDHLEIALQLAVFARCAVDGNECHVESRVLPVDVQGEIVFVDGILEAAFGSIAPIASLKVDQIGIEQLAVELVVDVVGRFYLKKPLRYGYHHTFV